jgi:YD repeat-containing protein
LFSWNARNQLIAISGSTTATFSYDALGRRISKTINGTRTDYQQIIGSGLEIADLI